MSEEIHIWRNEDDLRERLCHAQIRPEGTIRSRVKDVPFQSTNRKIYTET